METEPSHATDGPRVTAAAMDGVGIVAGTEYVYANDALADLHGYDGPSVVVGRAWPDLYEPREPGLTARRLLARVHRDGEWHGGGAAYRSDGDSVDARLWLIAIGDVVVCAVGERADGGDSESGSSRNRADCTASWRAREIWDVLLDVLEDGVYVLDEGFRIVLVNDRLREILERLGRAPEDPVGMDARALSLDDEHTPLARAHDRVIDGETDIGSFEVHTEGPDGESIVLECRRCLLPTGDGEFGGAVGVVRDATDRRKRERRLERHRDELDTLNRINGLLLDLTRDLYAAASLAAIKRTVCERLADSELYAFAWIGAPDGDIIRPQVTAGVEDKYVEAITTGRDGGESGRGPATRAFETGDVQVCQDVRTDPSFAQWCAPSLRRDVRSAAAVPLVHDETVYGVLAVYAARPLGFTPRERRVFEILGEAVGFAINAYKARELLYADSVTEVKFELGGADAFFVRAAANLDCSIVIDSYVSTGDGDWLVWISVSGGSSDGLRALARDDDRVRTVTLLDGDRAGTDRRAGIEKSSPLLDTITAVGGRLTGATFAPACERVTVEVPQSADLHALVDHVTRIYPTATLAALVEDQQNAAADAETGGNPLESLTDRQRQALETAYRAGYYDWPRASTAEDVAELLDIAAPTLHAHLRKAERALLSRWLDADANDEERSTPGGRV